MTEQKGWTEEELHIRTLFPSCDYKHYFVVCMGKDQQRPCVLDKGHKGNHVVVDPKSGKPLEVLAQTQ